MFTLITQNADMTPWERIDSALKTRKKNWKWLAAQLDMKPAAVGNWKGRGVPAKYYGEIATLLGETVDWVIGNPIKPAHTLHGSESSKSYGWPFDLVDQNRYEKLSPQAQGAAQMRMMDEIAAQESLARKANNGTYN